MKYRVEMTTRAARDLEWLFVEKNAAESEAAARWFNRMAEAIFSLEEYPARCPVAPEGKKAKRPLRHLLYGKKPHIYRIIYELDERRKTVLVMTIRHPAMEPMKPEDADNA